eukprot:gnl/TRDRNA2_/TRDRNA2_179135_c0_seq1.p1 gnl/TRDRNA2_/TRDRNA2_179135_c0~~gnl/TRDRNA2_/TRDRNA2_179135_c0_seq1.p1  ORF type:complete len:287 (-),score=64.76 gnl/TRDRNA2_/TRDRNA2_179135_c0_seq1:125-985(-)
MTTTTWLKLKQFLVSVRNQAASAQSLVLHRCRDVTMVLVEELFDDDDDAQQQQQQAAPVPAAPTKSAMQKGFLEKAHDPLYGPEGSKEGYVAPETHKKHQEEKMNKELNDGMNKGAKDNNGIERPPWYTKEWPKDCQYNAPGCHLDPLETSRHASELHRDMTRNSMRWNEQLAPGVTSMRMSFMQVCDEDVEDIVNHLKGNEAITELDLSHNRIKDIGVQTLVGALANGAAPNLKELRIYKNDWGDLGKTMLTKGLPVFRKKLAIVSEEPSIARLGGAPKPAEAAS